jgi:hypothetical protein
MVNLRHPGMQLSKNNSAKDLRSCAVQQRLKIQTGGDYRDRTGDLRLAKPALSQLS